MPPPRLARTLTAGVLACATLAAPAPADAATAVTTRWSQTTPFASTYQVTVKKPAGTTSPGTYRIDAESRTVIAAADLTWDKTFTVKVNDGHLDLALVGPKDLTGMTVLVGRVGGWPVAPAPMVPVTNPPIAAQRLFPGYPGTRAGRPLSGARVPRNQFVDELYLWGHWRGRQADAVMTYGQQHGYDRLAGNAWPITEWETFPGKIIYSLPLIPREGGETLAGIAAGRRDAVWDAVARQLRDHQRGDSLVRVGWEYNLVDMPWWTTTSNVADFKAAYRRIVTRMRAIAPGLRFEFGLACGAGLNGSNDRLAPLTMGYPGDDVVDLVGCDVYDWWQTKGSTEAQWTRSLRPAATPGIADVVDFARAHGKLASFAEWGLAPTTSDGAGDDPFWIQKMNDFFVANRDVVALEAYFEDSYDMRNSLSEGQAPQSAKLYRTLFGSGLSTPHPRARSAADAVRANRVANASDAIAP